MALFRRKAIEIEAIKVAQPMVLQTVRGTIKGDVGDFLLSDVDGSQSFISKEIFYASYDPVDENARLLLIED